MNDMPKKPESLTVCPKCGGTLLLLIWDPSFETLTEDTIIGVYCRKLSCGEEFFWYPRTGRITARTNVRGTVKSKKK